MARTDIPEEDEGRMNPEELREQSPDVLVRMILSLRSRLQMMEVTLNATRALKEASNNIDQSWTPEKIAERAKKLQELCAKEIKKQMKWQPSCKQGTTKWSYTGIVPNPEVFREMMGEEKKAKAWKMKKLPIQEFRELFGHITASVSACMVKLALIGERANLPSVATITYRLPPRMLVLDGIPTN